MEFFTPRSKSSRRALWWAAAIALIGFALPATAITLTPVDRGWYRQDGLHNAGNENTFTGTFASNEYRSFFAFDVSATGPNWNVAPFDLELDLYFNGDASETVEIFAVTSSAASVIAGASAGSAGGTAIFNDLGSGVSYGTVTFTASDVGTTVTVNLNAAAVADVNAARGGQFVFGVAHTTGNGGNQGVRFGTNAMWDGGNTSGAQVAEPGLATLAIAGLAVVALRRRRSASATA